MTVYWVYNTACIGGRCGIKCTECVCSTCIVELIKVAIVQLTAAVCRQGLSTNAIVPIQYWCFGRWSKVGYNIWTFARQLVWDYQVCLRCKMCMYTLPLVLQLFLCYQWIKQKKKSTQNKNCVARCYFYQRRRCSAWTLFFDYATLSCQQWIFFLFVLFCWLDCALQTICTEILIFYCIYFKAMNRTRCSKSYQTLPFSRKKKNVVFRFVFISCSFHLMGHKSIKYIH